MELTLKFGKDDDLDTRLDLVGEGVETGLNSTVEWANGDKGQIVKVWPFTSRKSLSKQLFALLDPELGQLGVVLLEVLKIVKFKVSKATKSI